MIRFGRKPLRAAALLLAALLFAPAGRAAGLDDGDLLYETPRPVPETPFKHKVDGLIRDVSVEDFTGRVVVLNFWATWCAPCVAEMPSLDRLQAELGGEGVTVIALSEDRGGFRQVDAFFGDHGLEALERYHDPGGKLAQAFKLGALPTTILIGPDGMAVGEVRGAAEWDSPEAKALIRALRK